MNSEIYIFILSLMSDNENHIIIENIINVY